MFWTSFDLKVITDIGKHTLIVLTHSWSFKFGEKKIWVQHKKISKRFERKYATIKHKKSMKKLEIFSTLHFFKNQSKVNHYFRQANANFPENIKSV